VSARQLVDALRQARADQGRTRAEVAAGMGIHATSTRSLQLWELGTNVPNTESLVRWANALGYDVTLTPRGEP
jgi:transcriptional regulator with XRE-family HTH domain